MFKKMMSLLVVASFALASTVAAQPTAPAPDPKLPPMPSMENPDTGDMAKPPGTKPTPSAKTAVAPPTNSSKPAKASKPDKAPKPKAATSPKTSGKDRSAKGKGGKDKKSKAQKSAAKKKTQPPHQKGRPKSKGKKR